jgi:hypothetical protein
MNSQGALPMSWPVVDAAEALTIVARGQGIGGTQGGAEGGAPAMALATVVERGGPARG